MSSLIAQITLCTSGRRHTPAQHALALRRSRLHRGPHTHGDEFPRDSDEDGQPRASSLRGTKSSALTIKFPTAAGLTTSTCQRP